MSQFLRLIRREHLHPFSGWCFCICLDPIQFLLYSSFCARLTYCSQQTIYWYFLSLFQYHCLQLLFTFLNTFELRCFTNDSLHCFLADAFLMTNCMICGCSQTFVRIIGCPVLEEESNGLWWNRWETWILSCSKWSLAEFIKTSFYHLKFCRIWMAYLHQNEAWIWCFLFLLNKTKYWKLVWWPQTNWNSLGQVQKFTVLI